MQVRFKPGFLFRTLVICVCHGVTLASRETKKADVTEHRAVFDHVGLLVDEPSSYAGLPFA